MFARQFKTWSVAFCAAFVVRAFGEVKDLPREGFDFFEKNIRPVLVEKCYKCHSTESEKIKADLRLDTKSAILKGGISGPSVIPFKPEESLLLKAVRYTDPDLQMPPKQKLTDFEIKNFEIWIKMGAPDPRKDAPDEKTYAKWTFEDAKEFWSFKPIVSSAPPLTKDHKWPKSEVDSFILAQLQEKRLTPVKDADRRTLIRRATYDLTGLPPTPREIEAFLTDKSPNAFEKVIDRLLSSPAYGEQWGRHWLDVARYADTSGCNSDFPVPTAYRYRNYVIESFNRDKPFDQFIREQIAGDLLPARNDDEKAEHIIATGYLAISRRFGSRNLEFHLTIDDTISTIGQGILGLSTGCARCHDHKFDPVSQKDYFALYGIFSSTKYAFPGTEVYRHPKDFVPLPGGTNAQALVEYQTELAKLDDELEELGDQKRSLEARLDENGEQQKKATSEDEKRKLVEDAKEFRTKLNEVKAQVDDAKTKQRKLEASGLDVPRAYAVLEGKPGNAKIQKKGNPFQLGDEVPRGFLQILGGQKLPADTKVSGRLQLAEWLTSKTNPLTARVMVNRIWLYHFGRGIVPTPNDFGTRGKAPTHPELLDYLATKFIDSGWSVKAMHKMIMLSRVYQLSSDDNLENAAIDVENNLLWRQNRRRLAAEEIRDSMLAVAGSLDSKMPGPHPFPPETEWKFSQHKPFYAIYETNNRSVYLMQQRIRKHPFLEAWDGADPNAPTGSRPLTTTPLQALQLMNSEFIEDCADRFAVRIGLADKKDNHRVEYAFELLYGRAPTSSEVTMATGYLKKAREELKKTTVPADQNSRAALASFAHVMFSSNEFLFID